ncbi:hypothetical protein CN498_04295 [Bacillus thuringiensis]|nr:hypothetical protein CN498_04295 [Bacillus thuringiensis]PGS45404.1 hypothetical protein COC65_10310 [Bacillus thuringiensis]
MFGDFAFSYEAQIASTSKAPSPSHSERTASAFNTILTLLLHQRFP